MQLDFPLPAARLSVLRAGALLVPDAPAVFQIEGAGALTCLQGLLTNDLVTPGEESLVYGALLTPKGMIVFDAWVAREASRFVLIAPGESRAAALELFRRALPPRLAKVTDLSETHRASWLVGGAAAERLARALTAPVPGAGRVLRAGSPDGVLLAGGPDTAPFSVLILAPEDERDRISARFRMAGGAIGDATDLAAAKVMAGWPTLGREIDDRTLPQEVRFDELGGVSYTKGCYTGQETVARVHFRGHVNRTLRGLEIEGGPPIVERTLMAGGKEVGRVGTALLLEGRALALGIVRREVETGASVAVGDRAASVVALPLLRGA